MELQLIYSSKSISLRYFPSTTSVETLTHVIDIFRQRFLLYFQATILLFKDGDGFDMSVANIIANNVSPIFIFTPDGTQNMNDRLSPTRNTAGLPLTKSNTYTVNPNGTLTEYLGKHPNIGKDNKAPFLVNASATAQKPEIKALTMEEIKKHNRKTDCWIILENKVYDITNYIKYHPGGDIILDAAGKDGTSLYQHYHPWVNVQALIGRFQIGIFKRT